MKMKPVYTMIALLLLTFRHVAAEPILIDNFENGLAPEWNEERFKGATEYLIVETDGNRVLQATSNNSASALIFEKEIDPKKHPILRWRWKSRNTVKKGDVRTKDGDDYPARIYIIFPHWFPPKTKLVNYIWANKLPKGDFVTSTFLNRSVMFAVESGSKNIGQWLNEERNVYEDFKRAFGKEPPMIGGIAIMSDTDQTGESVQSWYDDIRFERKE